MSDIKENKMAVKSLNLWPTRVWVFDFEPADQYRDQWCTDLIAKRQNDPHSKPSFSNRQGWNSNKEIFKDQVYAPLKSFANVLLSGCYYLKVPDRAGPIVFKEPRPGPNLAGLVGQGVNCMGDVKLKPKEGQLIIFPNWLEHYVEINESEDQRASIAMNALAVA
jgi:hypothetical protein